MRRLLCGLFLVFGFVLPSVAAFAADKRPNILFIAVDDLRPDLGCYGVSYAKSPHIDRLAARGIVFERAYCMQAVCSPSRTAVLTGLRPDTTKVWDLETHFRAAQPDCVTLPQYLRSQGYHTVGLGKIEHHGFEDGPSWSEPRWFASGQLVSVDPLDWTKHTVTRFDGIGSEFANPLPKPANFKGKFKAGPAYEVSPKRDEDLPDGATAVEAVRSLHVLKEQGNPFFLAVGFLKPHLPFVAPKKYWDMHDPAQIPGPATDQLPAGTASFVGHTSGELHSYPEVPKGNPLPEEFARTLRHGYHACVSYTDAQVGKLFDALETEGLTDSTIVVLWGDHGWQLGDHGLWHKHTNFELATRAPLLISVPHTGTAGRKCAAPVEFVDIYPTLAELCGLPIPAGLAGMSLKTYLDNPAAPMQKPAVSQYPRSSPDHGGALMGYSVRTEQWRATFWRKRNAAEITYTELYDEIGDPAETKNLAELAEHADLLASLRKSLPPAGSDATPPPSAKPKAATANAPADETRDQRFDRLYPSKQQLTLAEYLLKQGGDKQAAEGRFTKMDQNKDGVLTRAEFIGNGK